MDKHYCSKCGIELNDRDMCGFTEQPTCFKCAHESTDLNSEGKSVKVAYIGGLVFAIFFTALFLLAKYVFMH